MPDAAPVPDAPRWLSWRCAGLPAAGASPRSLLRRLLLGSYDAFVRGGGDERALDCAPGAACPFGETRSARPLGRARRRRRLCRRGRLDVVILTAAMTGMLIHSCGPLGTAPPEERIISGGKFHRSIVDSSIVEVHKRALDVSFFRVGSKAHLRSTAVREFYTG